MKTVLYPPSEQDTQILNKIARVLNGRHWPLSTVDVGLLNSDFGKILIVNFLQLDKGKFASENEADAIFRRVFVFLIRKGMTKKFSLFQSAIVINITEQSGTAHLWRKKVFCDGTRLRTLEKARFFFWSPLSQKTLAQLTTDSQLENLLVEPSGKGNVMPLPT